MSNMIYDPPTTIAIKPVVPNENKNTPETIATKLDVSKGEIEKLREYIVICKDV